LPQAPSRSIAALVRGSLMLRVLLPIATVLVVMVFAAVFVIAAKNGDSARTALGSKAKLVADIAGLGIADAVWNVDAQPARASLAALAADPDYVGSEVTDDHGKVFAADGAREVATGSMIVEKVPVIRLDQGQPKTIGALELRLSTARADAAIARDTLVTILAGLCGLIVVCGLLFWFLKSVTRPIEALTRVMADLSSGKLDVGLPALDRVDEVGRMAHAVEIFKRNAIEVGRLSSEQEAMKEQSGRDRVELLNRVASQFESTVSAVLLSVSKSSLDMSRQAEGLAGKMSSAESSTQRIMKATNTTSDSVQTVAAAAEELSTSINEISTRINDSASITVDTSNAAEKATGTIAELSEQVERIGSCIGLIHNVASQTDLLALNATIEAARAGDAGKGFAIVASEVKSLATQTARATDEISANIQAIQAATARAVAEIRTIAGIAGRSRDIATSIASAIEQQSAATREISASISRAASSTIVVTENAATVGENFGDASRATRDLLSASNELDKGFRALESQVQGFVATVRGAK
jgi:methyl-accepting chemotaxis protein